MRSPHRRAAVLAFGLVWAFSGESTAVAQDEAPWGYLYAFRTLRLYELTGDELTIGRLPESDVVLTSPRVSRQHAAVRRTEEGPELVDVGSSNGSRLNGEELRPRLAEPLRPGDRLQLADELVLYHESLDALWRDELELRLLTSIVKLRLRLPADETRKSLGREEIVPAVTEATVDEETGQIVVEHSGRAPFEGGFPEESAAFIAHLAVDVEDGALELSLWGLAGTESMTSRRSSFATLRHGTLRVVSPGASTDPASGPWFPPQLLGALFEIFPDEPEYSLRFAHALAEQERPLALRDAAESFAYRHELDPTEPQLLLTAAKLKGLAIEGEIGALGIGLKASDRKRLDEAIAAAWSWLERARTLGAGDDDQQEAAAAIRRAEERLARLTGE